MESFISSPNFANRFEIQMLYYSSLCVGGRLCIILTSLPIAPLFHPRATRDKAELCGKIYFCAIAKWNFHLNGGGSASSVDISGFSPRVSEIIIH